MGGITHVQERTVRRDGSVRFHRCIYRGKDEYDRGLLNRWAGKRVYAQYANYWGTEIQASPDDFMMGSVAKLTLSD